MDSCFIKYVMKIISMYFYVFNMLLYLFVIKFMYACVIKLLNSLLKKGGPSEMYFITFVFK